MLKVRSGGGLNNKGEGGLLGQAAAGGVSAGCGAGAPVLKVCGRERVAVWPCDRLAM